jgi:5'-nucleotidase
VLMMKSKKYQILLTNDDGIRSPGLWAAASSLEELGFVHVVAPREQCSGSGRSLPHTSDGIIETQQIIVNDKEWVVHAIGGTPAQAVLHGALEILPQYPDLLVSGINYGENLGFGVTSSGTVGAALEGAALGIPSLAVSLETDQEHHHSYSKSVDFSAAAYFTNRFSRVLLEGKLPSDVHVLKLDVPDDATPQTPWQVTRLSRTSFYEAVLPERDSWNQPGIMGYRQAINWDQATRGSDVYTVHNERRVSVTPLSLDLTSRVDFNDLKELLNK